jgi:arylformamidase
MDAPAHFVPGGKGIDEMPAEVAVGPARVIPIRDRTSIRVDELREHPIESGDRLLFKTRNSERSWAGDTFIEDFVDLSPLAAKHLAERGVRLVGIDYLSVGGLGEGGVETHRTLLEAGIWIIEGLDLSRVRPGLVELICLPLKIAGGDGAPARAFVRELGEG